MRMKLAAAAVPGIVSGLALLIAPSGGFTAMRTAGQVTLATTVLRESSPASFADEFISISKQKAVRSATGGGEHDKDAAVAASSSAVQTHLQRQRECFDEMSDFFNSEDATPPEVVPILAYIVEKALAEAAAAGRDGREPKTRLRILDVGCGTGALFPSYLAAADDLGIRVDVQGLDLSPRMAGFASENGRRLAEDGGGDHSIGCDSGDFVQKALGIERCGETLTGFEVGRAPGVDDGTSEYRDAFDAVVINSCFGNFYHLDSVVTAAASCLKTDGIFVISHPLGAGFVEKLGKESPATVPGRLPSKEALSDMLTFQPMETVSFVEDIEIDGEKKPLYYASIRKTPRRMLREVVRLRGPVDQGLGRGGKKLGFPTANLPSSLFADALAAVPTGVYVGSASLEPSADKKKGRGVVHKAVVNVGYSPTFDGEENKEKIVEAHLIIDDGAIEGDFYGETMRLSLSGFLRPEIKFSSFPDLIKAITNDVLTAKESLDLAPYTIFSEDPFLTKCKSPWTGKSGGDEVASFEFERTVPFLSKV